MSDPDKPTSKKIEKFSYKGGENSDGSSRDDSPLRQWILNKTIQLESKQKELEEELKKRDNSK